MLENMLNWTRTWFIDVILRYPGIRHASQRISLSRRTACNIESGLCRYPGVGWDSGSVTFSLCDSDVVNLSVGACFLGYNDSVHLWKFSRISAYENKGSDINSYFHSIYTIFWIPKMCQAQLKVVGIKEWLRPSPCSQAITGKQAPWGRIGQQVMVVDATFFSMERSEQASQRKRPWSRSLKNLNERVLWLSGRRKTQTKGKEQAVGPLGFTLNDGKPLWHEEWLDPIDSKSLQQENGL